jgi:flagellar basal-body rod protein FlgG
MLDAMITLAADQSTRAYQLLDPVSQNVGNYSTWGYKAVRFDQYMRPDGNLDLIKRVDHSPGNTFLTKRELDVAVNGAGYIQVTRQDGSTAYTRNGSLAKNAQGFLVTPHGDLVGTGIQVPGRYHQLHINADGKVNLVEKPGDVPKEIGHITLVNFKNPEGLKSIGENLMVATDESGAAEKIQDHQLLQQGRLEQSNVNIHYAVEDILRLNAGVIANLRVVKAVDDIYKEAVQLRQ